MIKLLTTVLLIICITVVKAQEPFQLNKSYPIGWVVTYPTASVMWISKMAVKAASYPVEGTSWTRYVPPVIIHDTVKISIPAIVDVNAISRKTIDSLNAKISELNSSINNLTTLINSIDSRVKGIENPPNNFSLKYYLSGTPLLNIVDSTTGIVRSLVEGKGIYFTVTPNQIVINKAD